MVLDWIRKNNSAWATTFVYTSGQMPQIADKNFMVFIARINGAITITLTQNTYNVGFEIINIAPSDMAIFQRMFEKYGSENTMRSRNSDDYLWK